MRSETHRRPYRLLNLLLCATLCLYFSAAGQSNSTGIRELDSLNQLVAANVQSNSEQAKSYALKSLAQARKHTNRKGQALGYIGLGMSSIAGGNYDSALVHYNNSLQFLDADKDKALCGKVYMGMGTAYNFLAKHDKALDYNYKALKIYETLDDKIMQVTALSNIGIVHEGQQQYEKALAVYERCRQINSLTKNQAGMGDTYGNFGKVYSQMGNFPEAIKNHRLELQIWEQLQDSFSMSYAYDNLSNALAASGQLQEGLSYQQKALHIYEQYGNSLGTANSLCNLGNIHYELKNYDKALDYLLKATSMAETLQARVLLNTCYASLTDIYLVKSDYKNAYSYLQKTSAVKDSIYTLESSRQMADVEALYKNEKLAREKLQVEKENMTLTSEKLLAARQRNNIIFGSLALLVLLGTGFYIYNQKQKRREEKQRINAMLLSEDKERTRIARELHDGLGQLLSTARINAASLEESVPGEDLPLLRNTLSLIDQSVTEVRAVSHNLMPQMLSDKGLQEALGDLVRSINTSKNLQVEFSQPDAPVQLDKTVETALYRVVQEVLNNMIRHSGAGRIDLRLSVHKNNLSIFIGDNGKGFDVAAIEKSEGLGWKNIGTRLALINGKFDISSSPGKGTEVTIDVAL